MPKNPFDEFDSELDVADKANPFDEFDAPQVQPVQPSPRTSEEVLQSNLETMRRSGMQPDVISGGNPLQVFPAAGAGVRAGLADIGRNAADPIPYATGQQNYFENLSTVGRNLEAAAEEKPVREPLPTDLEMAKSSKLVRYPYKIAGGLVQTAPSLLAVSAAEAIGIPAPIAAAGIFGTDEEGKFSIKNAAIAAALPEVGKFGGRIAQAMAEKYGVESQAALGWLKSGGAITAANAYLGIIQSSEIANLPPEQRNDAVIDALANDLGQSLLGLYPDKTGTVKDGMKESAKRIAALLGQPQVVPGLERYFSKPEKQNIRGPTEEYIPPEPGPLGVIPPGGTVPVGRGRLRVNIRPTPAVKSVEQTPMTGAQLGDFQIFIGQLKTVDDLRKLRDEWDASPDDPRQKHAIDLINQRIETIQNERKSNATQTGQEQAENIGQYSGTSQGGNVSENEDQVRQAQSGQAGSSDSTQQGAGREETPPVSASEIKEAPVKFVGTQQGVKNIPAMDYYNLTEDIPGHSAGSTIGRKELESLGYTIPQSEDTSKTAVKTETRPSDLKFPPVEVPAGQIVARPEVMQFKEIGDVKTGENEGEKLDGQWDESKAGLLMLWEPKDPAKYGLSAGQKYIVANGHHRFAFGERESVKSYGAQIFREADGYSAQDARRIAAEANIADGKGTVYDQVKYLRNSPSTRGENAKLEAARRIGNRGKQAVNIAFNAGDDLYVAFVNEKITPEQTEAIANAAPTNLGAQRVGIKFAVEGKSSDFLDGIVRRALLDTGGKSEDLDLFGNDDSAMKKMAEDEAKAEEIRQGIRDQIRSIQGAANNPKLARKLGVDVKDPASIIKKLDGLKTLLARWQNWFISGNEDLQKQIRGNELETKPAAPEVKPSEPVKEPETKPVIERKLYTMEEASSIGMSDLLAQGYKWSDSDERFHPPEVSNKKQTFSSAKEYENALWSISKQIIDARKKVDIKSLTYLEDAREASRLETEFEKLSDEIELSKAKRRYILTERAVSAREKGGSMPRPMDIIGSLLDRGLLEVPKSSDFDPDATVRRSRAVEKPVESYDTLAEVNASLKDAENRLRKAKLTGSMSKSKREQLEKIVAKRRKQIADGQYAEAQTEKRKNDIQNDVQTKNDIQAKPAAPSGSLFREASAQDVDSYVNPATSARMPFGTPEIYAATNPDLALGQGKNKTGIIVEFDPKGLDVGMPRNQKPGSEFVESQGGGGERVIRAQPPELRKSVKSVTLLDGKSKDPYRIRLKRFLDANWNADKQEGKTVYTPKGEEKPALKLAEPESVEAQKARELEEAKSKAAEAEKQKLADAAAKPLVGTVGDIGQRELLGGDEDLFSSAPAKPTKEKPSSDEPDLEKVSDLMGWAQQYKMARWSEKDVRDYTESELNKRAGEYSEADKSEVHRILDNWYRSKEKSAEPTLSEDQKRIISAVQKYRIGTSPQTYSLVERLEQSPTEKEIGEQPVKIKNDKTGEVQTVLEQDLKAVNIRSAEERAAGKSASKGELDDLIRKQGLDPKDFPDKAAKREVLKRLGKLSKREAAEGIAEKLESKKIKGKPDELFVTLFPGLDPASLRAVWNSAIDVAQAVIRAGGTLADGIERAIESIRSNVKTQWDEPAVRSELEKSIGPIGEDNERHQVAGVRNIGSEYEPENIRAIQSRLRVGYFDGTQPVETSRTENAWDIVNRLVNPQERGAFAQDLINDGGGNMAPGLMVKELWDYAVKMAVAKDDSLMRFIVSRYAEFETVSGGGSNSKAGQVLRSARELSANPLWRALVKMNEDAAKSANRRLGVGDALFNDIISRINEISLTPEEIDRVINEGRDSKGRTLQQILDENSPERTAANDALQRYSPQVKSTALETVYEWLKENSGDDEKTFTDSLTKALVDLKNVDLDEATARQIAEGTWTRKNTVETARRRSAWDRVLKELDERAQRTAQSFVNRLEKSQIEWQKNPERKNEALKVIREALDPKTQLPAQTPSLFKIPLRDSLMALGVSRDIATRLVNEIYEKRLSEWATARTRAMERAAQSGSVQSLIEAIRSSPYRAQKDSAWRQRTAEDWFMSNGLSRDQAVTAAKLFSDNFENALQDAGEKLATKLLNGKSPRSIADVIKAIRAGLTDPSRNWVEDIAALNGWKTITPEQHAQLADIDSQLSDPSLSLPEQSELFDKMNSIVQRAGDGSKRWKYAIGELFASAKLSGLKTLTLHIFQPITATFVRDFPIATIFQTKDLPTIARAYIEAAKNFFPELSYAWQKDVYYLSQSKMISYHNELRNQFEDGLKSLKAGNWKGALKLTYAWSQYFLRALQSANQANQAIIREWKLSLYGSQAMRDAGMSTGEIGRIVDTLVEMKQAAYEEGLSRGMSKNAAYVRADDLAFQQMRQYFGQTIPGDLPSIASDIIRSAENDQYSTVGRLSPENTGKEEGWASEFLNKLILRPASELRKDGGFKSVVGMTVFGFVSIPLRVARYLSNFSPYGFVRYGRYKLGQSKNWENPWTQSYSTSLQAQQRIREAIVGTAGGLLAMALFHTTADPDRDKRKFGIYVSGAWKGITSRVERDALDKIGFKPLSLHVVIDGKVRSSIPMTRTGHALGYLFGLSSMADDIAWKNKEAAVNGKEVPVSTDVVSALGTLYYIVGQQGFLQSVSHFQTVAQGSVGGAAIEKSIADAASSLAGGFIPGQVFLSNMTELIKGPLDKSSIASDIAANFPVVGAKWQKQAINRLGDPLYDQTWYGKSLRLGAPIAFKVAQNPENERIYGMMVDKGVAPPELRRYIIEEKYGALTDTQWSQFSKLSGDLLKQTIVGNLATLQGQDPADAKKFLNKAGTTANNEAADSIGLESQKKASATSASPSGGVSIPSATSGASAGPSALRGLPKSTGAGRIRRIGLRRSGSGAAGSIRVSKLRPVSRRIASRGLRSGTTHIASTSTRRRIGLPRQRKIMTV